MLQKSRSKMRLTASLFLFFLCEVSFSQTIPGYMGKRLTIGYGGDFMVAASSTARSSDGGLNHSHSLNFEYTIRNRTNACLSFRYFKTGISLGSYLSPSGYVTYIPKSKLPMQLSSYDIGIGFKFFHRGYLAPVGKYRKPEVLILINKVQYEKNAFNKVTQSGLENVTAGSGSLTAPGLGITYQLGRQRVLGDKILLDTGVRFGLMFDGFFSNAGSFLLEINDSNHTLDDALVQEIKDRVFVHEIFNVHIGIGFLAF